MKMSNSVFKETTGAGEEAQSGGTTAEGAHSGEKTTNFRAEMQMWLRFGRFGWGLAQILRVSCVCQRVSVSKNTLWKREISWQVIEMSLAGRFSISAVDHWELHRYRALSTSCKGWKWADALPCNGVVQSRCGYKKEHPLIFHLGKAMGKPTSQSPLMHIMAFIICWMGCLKKDHELRVVPLLQGPLHHCFLAFLSGQQRRTGIPFDSQGQ